MAFVIHKAGAKTRCPCDFGPAASLCRTQILTRREALMPLRVPVTVAVTPLASRVWSHFSKR